MPDANTGCSVVHLLNHLQEKYRVLGAVVVNRDKQKRDNEREMIDHGKLSQSDQTEYFRLCRLVSRTEEEIGHAREQINTAIEVCTRRAGKANA